MHNNTSISAFLKDSSIENEFNSNMVSSIYTLKENLITFDTLINAPDYEPDNEPISIFRNMGDSILEEEEEETKQHDFKDTLRNVIRKYIAKNHPENGQPEPIQVENEQNNVNKIPDIGKPGNSQNLLRNCVT